MDDHKELKEALEKFRVLFIKGILPQKIIKSKAGFLQQQRNKREWTSAEAFEIYKIMEPYSERFKLVGYDFSKVPKVKAQIGVSIDTSIPKTTSKTIGYNGDVFIIALPYIKQCVEDLRRIPTAKYEPEKRQWTVQINQSKRVREFAEFHEFMIGQSAQDMMRMIEQNLEASYKAEKVDLDIPLPEGLEFFPFQSAGIDYGIKNERIIVGDQMGLGKTIQGIGIALGLERIKKADCFPVIISCPKSLRYNWQDEIHKWTSKKAIILDHKNAQRLETLISIGEADFVITNYEGVKTHFCKEVVDVETKDGKTYKRAVMRQDMTRLFKMAIVDEAHELRNMKTVRFKTHKGLMKHMDYITLLTGTPVVNKADDLAALLDIIRRIDEFGGRHKFLKTHRVGKESFDQKKQEVAHAELKALNVKLRTLCFIRREKFQVLKELPEKFRQIIRVDLDNQKEYDLAEFSLQEHLARSGKTEAEITRALQAELLVKINELKKLSAKGKLHALREFINDTVILGGEKLVIFCWYNATAQWIRDQFDNVLTITGKIDGRETTDFEIQQAKKKFQEDDKYKIIVVTYKKGGVGHTLTAASKVAFIELGWTYKDQSQAEDRCHRIGQLNTVNAYYLLGNETIDEDIYEIIMAKKEIEKHATGSQEEIKQSTFKNLLQALRKKAA